MQLSIIIPVYCAEQYISRCLESIFSLGISSNDYEVICIDDCSKDSSVTIIESYQKTHDNLILIHHSENKRQGGARNTGIQQAKGDYFIFVDADDYIPKYDIKSLLTYMKSAQLDLLIASADIKMEDGTTKRWGNAPTCESPIMKGPDIFTDEYIHKIAFGVVWLGIYRKDLLNTMRPFVEKVPYEDTDWTLQCAYESTRLQYLPVTIYNYIQNPVSTTRHDSIQSMIFQLRQGLRVWQWAQSVTENQNAVVFSAKDYCIFNLNVLRSLWKYSFCDRKELYHSFSNEEWKTMKNWGLNRKDIGFYYVTYPKATQGLLFLISPILRIAKYIKNHLTS